MRKPLIARLTPRGGLATWAAREPPGAGPRGVDVVLAAVLFAVAFLVFFLAPVRQFADSHYALLQSESLYRHHHADLDEFFPSPPLDPRRFPGLLPDQEFQWWEKGYPYQLERGSNGSLLYRYGPGTSFLSIPLVAVYNRLGVSTIGPDGRYDVRADWRMQTTIAALVAAGIVVALFALARLLLPPGWAAALALGVALASPVLSTASRALWSHTWATFLLTLGLAVVVRSERDGAPPPGTLLGILLSAAVLVRPAAAVHAIVMAGYVFLRHRRSSWRLAATGVAGALVGLAWSWQTRGAVLPSYYQGRRLTAAQLPEALAGHLLSPSRGLLVFCPLVLLAVWLAVRHAREAEGRRLLALSLVAMVFHLLLVSTVRRWWGGFGYGPRLLTELVPWWFLLLALGLDGVRRIQQASGRPPPGWRIERVLLVILLSWGLFVHGRGATVPATWAWNSRPQPIDSAPERAWSWSEPQFLAGMESEKTAGR